MNYNRTDMWIPIERLKEDPNNPRKIFSAEHIQGLAQSIQQEGFINPIECDGEMMIITGACRFRAAKLLNWKKVPIRINKEDYSAYERLRHQLAENIHQSGSSFDAMMNPIDTAKGFRMLLQLKGHDFSPGEKSQGVDQGISELSTEIGIPTTTIWEHLKLLEEPEFVQTALEEGLPRTYIREVNNAPVEVQDELRKKVVAGDYKSREDIAQDVQLLKKLPNLAQATLERQKSKENASTNRILTGVAKLALAIEAMPLEEIQTREKVIIIGQLQWLLKKIGAYLR